MSMEPPEFGPFKRTILLLLGLLGIMQVFQAERTNPPSPKALAGPDNVKPILQRACYACHSHETDWPWYSYVAPISWYVSDQVFEARKHLNFSEWRSLSAKERQEMRHEIYKEIQDGHMPPDDYALLHSSAELSQAELEILRDWSRKPISDKPRIKPAPQLRQADPKTK